MKWQLLWSPGAIRELRKLPASTSRRIVQKMDWFIEQDDPLHFSKPLHDATVGTCRFRIGEYRVLCDVRHGEISIVDVLAVRSRKNAYRS